VGVGVNRDSKKDRSSFERKLAGAISEEKDEEQIQGKSKKKVLT